MLNWLPNGVMSRFPLAPGETLKVSGLKIPTFRGVADGAAYREPHQKFPNFWWNIIKVQYVCLGVGNLSGGKASLHKMCNNTASVPPELCAVVARAPSQRRGLSEPVFVSGSARSRTDNHHSQLVLRRAVLLRRWAVKPQQFTLIPFPNFWLNI